MSSWEELMMRMPVRKPKDEPKGVVGRPPSLTPEETKDVRELVAERVKIDLELKKLERQIAERKQKIFDLKDRRALLTNSQIGRVFNVSHNVIREIVLGQYRWKEVDAGHR